MSKEKKAIRAAFRDAVFKRDGYVCKVCRVPCDLDKLDAHHIHPRIDMPYGGYVPENGITLCPACHIKAEAILNGESGIAIMLARDNLYVLIGSSYEMAVEASKIK